MDIEKARFLMVEQQIRPWEVLDQAVLDLLITVKREDFIAAAYRSLAFVDMEIPLGHGQLMMTPKLEARIVQEVAPREGDSVLEIGTGSGYLAALLAKRAASVTSIEIFEDLSRGAAANLAQAGIANVQLKVGDGAQDLAGLVGGATRFDVIVLSASVPILPPALLDYLNIGGRLFAVIGDAPVMKATVFTRSDALSFQSNEIFETVLAPLVNAVQPSRFTF
jgi:protein-L-isoaspartate(D-aspartate) O-methyltransferase